MEKKPENLRKVNELKFGHRYSLINSFNDDRFVFKLIEVDDYFLKLLYNDGKMGYISKYDKFSIFYEFPYSPLEKELL